MKSNYKQPGAEDLIIEAKNFFQHNKEDLGESIRKRINIITLDFIKLTEFSTKLSDEILVHPEKTLKLIELALEEAGLVKNARVLLTNIGQNIDIHKIRAKNIGEIFTIKGIIKRITKVIPRTVNIKYKCASCGALISIKQYTRRKTEPKSCSCGRRGGFPPESEEVKNIQELNLEEIQDNLDGKQPQQLRIYLEDELTDGSLCARLQPGRRVEVIGIVEKLPVFMNKDDLDSNLSEFMMYANNIIPCDSEDDLTITEEDLQTIREIAANDPLEKLSESLVPEVYGNSMVKKAICLQCVKGIGKERSDGSKGQEDIHILITGDVGQAKSVILKATAARTPRARMVIGTKTSKVGLGAMAVKDELTSSWSLEIGALVLANGSTLCLDELDKMYKENLSELLEPMSISTITIAKAGINATLPSRTSILAAANPIHGNYDLSQPLAKQIDLPTPILNRFDLIFIMLDRPNEEFDSKAVEHIFKSYKDKMEPEIPINLFKKYITYCRKLKPILDEGLVNYVQDFYVTLREKSRAPGMNTIPVNLRNMEAVVKLAEAHAKLRLSEKVEVLDLNVAKEIFMFCVKQLGVDEDTGVFDMSRMCYSEDTKVLTKEGFKLHNEIKNNEEILTINPKTRKLNWEKPLSLFKAHVENEDLIHFFSPAGVDMLVTPNHKIWYATSGRLYGKGWKEGNAQDCLRYKQIRFNNLAKWKGNNIKNICIHKPIYRGKWSTIYKNKKDYNFDANYFLEILGWIISEGHIDKYRVQIAQVNIENVKRIEYLLKKLNIRFNKRLCRDKRGYKDIYRFDLGDKHLCSWLKENIGERCVNKHIPRFILDLSESHLKFLFKSLMLGDGSKDKRIGVKGNYSNMAYHSKSMVLCQNVQELAMKLGYNAHINIHRIDLNTNVKYYIVNITDKTIKNIKRDNIIKQKYTGDIYCFKVPSGYYVTSRNNKLSFQGNSEKLPLSKRGKLERFFEIICTFCDNEEKEVRYGVLLEEALKVNIKSWEANMFIEALQKEMKIYEPRKGFYRLVER